MRLSLLCLLFLGCTSPLQQFQTDLMGGCPHARLDYYGPKVGDTTTMVPGTAVASWVRMVSVPGMIGSVTTRIVYNGRTGDKTYSFTIETQKSWADAPPPEPVTIYYQSATTRASVSLLSFRILQEGSEPRIVTEYHPDTECR